MPAYRPPITDPDIAECFWEKVDKTPSCWHWMGYRNKDNSGKGHQLPYGRFGVNRVLRLAHRVAWRLARGGIPEGRLVLHLCDVPYCVNPDHLFLGNSSDNAQDRVDKGRHVGNRKLDEKQVREIRRRYASGDDTYAQLAGDFGVSIGCVQHIVQRRTWRHIS